MNIKEELEECLLHLAPLTIEALNKENYPLEPRRAVNFKEAVKDYLAATDALTMIKAFDEVCQWVDYRIADAWLHKISNIFYGFEGIYTTPTLPEPELHGYLRRSIGDLIAYLEPLTNDPVLQVMMSTTGTSFLEAKQLINLIEKTPANS